MLAILEGQKSMVVTSVLLTSTGSLGSQPVISVCSARRPKQNSWLRIAGDTHFQRIKQGWSAVLWWKRNAIKPCQCRPEPWATREVSACVTRARCGVLFTVFAFLTASCTHFFECCQYSMWVSALVCWFSFAALPTCLFSQHPPTFLPCLSFALPMSQFG